MTYANLAHKGVRSPHADNPAVARTMRSAAAVGLALAIVLLACAAGLVISGLVNQQYLIVVCVVALLPGILGLGLLAASRRVLRGELFGTKQAMGQLTAMSGLVILGLIGSVIEGPWPAMILMAVLAAGTAAAVVLMNRAERALQGQ